MAGQVLPALGRAAPERPADLRPAGLPGSLRSPEIFSSCSALSEVNHCIFSFPPVVPLYKAEENEQKRPKFQFLSRFWYHKSPRQR